MARFPASTVRCDPADFSLQVLDEAEKSNTPVLSNLTGMKELKGIFDGTSEYRLKVTGKELLHIEKNWNTKFHKTVRFFHNGKELHQPPWINPPQ